MLTKHQCAIYEMVRHGIETTGRSPTYQVMADADSTSKGHIHSTVSRICERGWLVRWRGMILLAKVPVVRVTDHFDYFAVDYANPTSSGWPRLVEIGVGDGTEASVNG